MNPTIFYNNKKNCAPARPFLNPELSEHSDLSSESDESIHSESDFSESNNEPLITDKAKPNSSIQNGGIKKETETATIVMESSKVW